MAQPLAKNCDGILPTLRPSFGARLRDRRLDGHKFRRQAPIGPYIVDFCCFSRNLIVEVDGGQHAGSQTDNQRTRLLKIKGFRELRFWNHYVLANTEGVLEVISCWTSREITFAKIARSRPPPPNPLPRWGGGFLAEPYPERSSVRRGIKRSPNNPRKISHGVVRSISAAAAIASRNVAAAIATKNQEASKSKITNKPVATGRPELQLRSVHRARSWKVKA